MSPIILHDDTDPIVITTGETLDTEHGGTGSNLSATGPGVVIQASASANLTVKALGVGGMLYTDGVGVIQALAPNPSSTRKFLMNHVLIAGQPFYSLVQLQASDIVSGTLALAVGGSGSDLTGTGPGLIYQSATGGNFSVSNTPTITGITIDPGAASGTVLVEGDSSQTARVRLSDRGLSHYWDLRHSVGAASALGAFSIYNSDVGTSAISIDIANNVTLSGLTAASGLTASPRNFHTGGIPAQVSTDGTDATPVNTEVYIAEVFVLANCTITGVANFNGSVASGNLKVGLASSAGAVLATSASTSMAGTDTYQRVPFTATYAAKGPATYYVLLFVDNGTARYNAHTIGSFGAAKQTGQTYATGFTTITPPTTFTASLGPIASLY